jgi:large subunit ribosomal protein L3
MPVLYGTKVGMTRIYDGDTIVPVTVIECLPNEVVQVKTKDNDGVTSLKVAVGRGKKNHSKACLLYTSDAADDM